MIDGKSILVTGATGSFGRRFVETLIGQHQPRRLVVFSRDELKQFELQQSLSEERHPCLRYFIGDVRDRERVMRAADGVDIIIHAAAMKQIVAAERNPTECIATNVIGAQNIIDAAIEHDVKRVIALSTDKAANPINLYGATKLCSDKLFIAANNLSGKHRTRFAVVRYGNVAGSRGSVIPFFKRLLSKNMTRLPVTDPAMTRFVITLDQGVRFVLGSLERMTGGELFVPKLPSVRITDLVDIMAGPDRYETVGIRPGEKLHEVMIPLDESRMALDLGDYYVIQPNHHWWNVTEFLEKVRAQSTPVDPPFEYASNSNDWWLEGAELRQLVEQIPAA